MRLQPQQSGWIGKHRPRIRLCEPMAFDYFEKRLRMTARHVRVALAGGGRVAEVAPAVDHLLRRAAADPELQPAARNDVRRAGVLRHVERVLVAHVDDGRTDFDPLRARSDGGKERKRRAELAGEVMYAEVGAVGAEFVGDDRELERLQERITGAPDFRAIRIRPVPE